jgi:hypothetical protein
MSKNLATKTNLTINTSTVYLIGVLLSSQFKALLSLIGMSRLQFRLLILMTLRRKKE